MCTLFFPLLYFTQRVYLSYFPNFSRILTGVDIAATRQIFIEHLHPQDLHLRQQAYEMAEKSGMLSYEARFVWKDRSIHWVKILSKYIFNSFGNPISITGIVTDISEKVEKNLALQLAKEKFSLAFDNAPVGIAFADTGGFIHQINGSFAAILCESRNELLGRNLKEFTSEKDLMETSQVIQDLIDGKQTHFKAERCLLRKDQKEQWAHLTINCFEVGGEKQIMTIAYGINGEIKARAEQEKLLSILEHSPDVISVFDHEGRINYVNEIGKKLLDIEDPAGLTISRIFSPGFLYDLKREILPVLNKHGSWTGKQQYKNLKTAELIDVTTSVFALRGTLLGISSGYASIGRDIRGQLAAEKGLRDSETLFRIITDASSAALWITDAHGLLTYISKTWIQWTGAPLEMQLGNGWMNYVASDDLERVKDSFWEDFNTRAHHHVQFCIVHLDGTVRCVVCNGLPQYNDKNEFTGYIGAITDITDLIEAQKRLAASEEMMRSMIQQSPVAIGLFETEALVIKSANPVMLDFMQKGDTVIGMELTSALPELRGQEIIQKFKEVLTSGKAYNSYDTTVVLAGKNGPQRFYFNISCTPIQTAENQISEVMIMATDLTWQHQARAAVKAGETRFRNLIESAPVACALFIGRDLVVEFTNDAMIKIWGKGDTVQGKTLKEALPELEGQPYFQILDNVYQSAMPYHSQSAPVDLVVNGILSTYYFDFSYTPLLDGDGQVYGILDMAVEVTERVMALRELLQSEQQYRSLSAELETLVAKRTQELNFANSELISSNQSLEQFAYFASHDLQEPLRKIVSFGTRLASKHTGQLDDEGKYLLSRMQFAAERMSLMVSDLLSFSRLTANHKAFSVVDLNQVMSSVISDLEISILEKQATINVGQLMRVWGDYAQLTQLLLNLVSNALKYQPVGQAPIITVSTAGADPVELMPKISMLEGHSYVKLQVDDNGIGFDQKNVPRIFQMFQRLHGKNEYSGSGIGLAMCNKIVLNHNGLLTAESEVGKGSCFIAYLPAPK